MAQWSEQAKTDALDQLRNGNTLAQAHHDTGIPKPTLIRWAKTEGIEVERSTTRTAAATEATVARWAERRAKLADEAGEVAALTLARIKDLVPVDALEAQRLATVFGVTLDKAQLLTGAATARTEHLAPDRTPEQESELAQVLELVRTEDAA